jgi:serine/threonine protein kinase
MNGNWTSVSESRYPWEREALDFVRDRFPSHEPYRAWSNFEFIADDGSINEVDLLLFTPQGFFVSEIKSRPGRLTGDAGTWVWETEGKLVTTDNPLLSANAKAKKLRALLQRQRAFKNKGQVPYIEALVFCSAPELKFELQGTAAQRVCLRDREKEKNVSSPARPGILAAILRRECPGLEGPPKGIHDRPTARMVAQAMDQAGIRPSQSHKKVSDYFLERTIGEGPGYQDWLGIHVRLDTIKRRIRLYNVRAESSPEDRARLERAALREFQLLETLEHTGILRIHGFSEHQLGPALIFEHDPLAIRLDHFLAQRRDSLGVGIRLEVMRQIAEVVRFAHDKKVVHRGLCPQSILVTDASTAHPRIKIFNWQAGYREATTTSKVSQEISATSHVDRLVDDASTAYMAPEAVADVSQLGEHVDVFSLGAIAFHLFSSEPPAKNGLELSNKLRENKGLQISSVMNGASESLQELVRLATHPEVPNRIDDAADFLEYLDAVEDELTAPEEHDVVNPTQAQKGDVLAGGFHVLKRLGQGACSVAFLVEHDGQQYVLKAASDPEQNPRIQDEAKVLQKLRHQHIVEFCKPVQIGDHAAFLMRPVLVDKSENRVETLGQRLRKEGRLHVDHLQRFGVDLLEVVNYLQEQGIAHRDIKPDNIAVGMVGRGNTLHVVLFDFSLSRTPTDNIRAGTKGYLDPLLPLRKSSGKGDPARWDLHAERYAAAATLHELASGDLPQWGDGKTDASHLDCEITIDAEKFDASLRERLTAFFRKAFRRDVSQRFDNAEEMLREWRHCFENLEESVALSDHEDLDSLRELLAGATYETQIHELGLGTRATNALDRANLLTVEDLLSVPIRRIARFRGVGNKTRREIITAVRILRERFGARPTTAATSGLDEEPKPAELVDSGNLSIDLLAERLLPRAKAGTTDPSTVMIGALLGLDDSLKDLWPSQSSVAGLTEVTRARVGQVVAKFQRRWAKEPAITRLHNDLVGIIESAGGAMAVAELAEAIVVMRGCFEEEPFRTRLGRAVVRAAVEVERTMGEPRFQVRRDGVRVLVALTQDLADFAFRLGDLADKLAAEDPLVPPQRVLERLREVVSPIGAPLLSDSRLIRLAAAASSRAALSSRQELYPKGMDAGRALKLSQGALYNVPSLTVQEIRERVRSRYPEAALLPDPPALDPLLEEAGFGFQWDPALKGVGGYISRLRDALNVSSRSESAMRQSTALAVEHDGVGEVTPEVADARQFEERLRHGIKEGSFYALVVNPKYYHRAYEELCRRFPVQLVDFEELFLDTLRQEVDKAGARWEAVVGADATPGDGKWDRLMVLVRRAMPQIEAQLSAVKKPALVIYAGLLARYDQMILLERLRDKIGRHDGIPGLWLLLAGDHQALLDGKPVPVLSPGQHARIPESWLENQHRANGIKAPGK